MTYLMASSTRCRLACAVAITIAAMGAALPASTSSAIAADMPVQVQTAAAPIWSGFYIGGHGGGGWGSSGIADPAFQVAFEPVTIQSHGPLAGAQLGADWQFGMFVVGGEISASWASIHGGGAPDPLFPRSVFTTRVRALATATARAGLAAGSVLGYVKGGVAWADLEFGSLLLGRIPGVPGVISYHRTGITGGGGLEVAFFRNLSAKVEYNAVYFGDTSMSIGGNRDAASVDHLFHVVKAGVNLRFGGDYIVGRN